MYISRLGLTNFRNFRHLDLELPQGPVVLFGSNAQGKTSLLEAIYLLAIAKSFRADNEREVVNWCAAIEEGQAVVSVTVAKQDTTLRVIIGYQCIPTAAASQESTSGKNITTPPAGLASRPIGKPPFVVRKEIRVSRAKRSALELVGLVNAVLFSAEDLQLIYGPPSLRRRYLDILLSQISSAYLKGLQHYQRVLYQRNQLLKLLQAKRASEKELDFWNEELISEGSRIVWQRHQAMSALSSLAQERHAELTGQGNKLLLEYRPTIPSDSSLEEVEHHFRKALELVRERELHLGATVVGPHRDDFKLLDGDVDMGIFASRGQARTLALTLRLAEAAYLASTQGEEPILLLDDVLSELDISRRSRVLDAALKYHQAIITTTDLDPFTKSFLANATSFRVEGGKVALAEVAAL